MNGTRIAVAGRADDSAGLASYLAVAGIAASLIVVWAGICLI
ncbi:MAG TPA: hypothetical protein VGG99_20775 [Acetobacteraceae bacterium]